MPFNDGTNDTFERASFKLLQGLAHTTNDKDPANESESSTVTLGVQEIFAVEIPTDPDQAVIDTKAVFTTLDLVLDPSSNGKAYLAEITTVIGSGLETFTNPRTASLYADGDRVGFFIPPKFGSDYRVILRDVGVEVPPLSFEDWYFDYRAGIITSEDNLSLTTGTLDGYVYVGGFAASSPWSASGDNISNTNDGYVGIGTAGPESILHIADNVAGNPNDGVFLTIQNTSVDTEALSGILFKNGVTATTSKGGIFWEDTASLGRGTLHLAVNESTGPANASLFDSRIAIDNTGNVGFGTTSPDTNFHFISDTPPLIKMERTSILSSIGLTVFDIRATSTNATLSDGFGPLLNFSIEDSTGPSENIARISAVRDNSLDNTGSLLFQVTDDDIFSTGLKVNYDGYVGITGITSPQQSLHTGGSIRLGSSSNETIIGDFSLALGADGNLLLVSDVNATGATSGGDIIFGSGSVSAATNVPFNTHFPFGTPRVEHMRIEGDTGFVGIGTTAPTTPLHVISGNSPVAIIERETSATGGSLNGAFIKAITSSTILSDFGVRLGFSIEGAVLPSTVIAAIAGSTEGADEDNSRLEFYTRETGTLTEKMTLTSDGYLGLGTTSPEGFFHISDNVAFSESDGVFALFQNTNSDTGALTGLQFKTGTSSDTTKGAIFWEDFDTFGRGKMHFATNNTASGTNVSLQDAVMTIENTGMVGIGTTSPTRPLEVDTETASTSGEITAFKIKTTSTGNMANGFGPRMRFAVEDDAGVNEDIAAIDGVRDASDDDAGKLQFCTATTAGTLTTRMVVDSSGNVGIGTETPGSLLEIESTTSGVNGISLSYDDTTVVSGNIYPSIVWTSNDASTDADGERAKIEARASGSTGNTDLHFYNTIGGSTVLNRILSIVQGGPVAIEGDISTNPAIFNSTNQLTIGTTTGERGNISLRTVTSSDISFIHMEEFDGTDQFIWVDNTGRLMIDTSAPSGDDTGGTVIGTQSFNY
jgi:hypothetical protein